MENRLRLHKAARDGRIEEARELLDSGESVDAVDEDGRTPLYVAAENNQTGMVALFIDRGADVNAKADASWRLPFANVKEYKQGPTPLHIGAEKGYLDVVRLLLVRGADVNARDDKGKTPLDLARRNGHTEVVALLFNWGANTDER